MVGTRGWYRYPKHWGLCRLRDTTASCNPTSHAPKAFRTLLRLKFFEGRSVKLVSLSPPWQTQNFSFILHILHTTWWMEKVFTSDMTDFEEQPTGGAETRRRCRVVLHGRRWGKEEGRTDEWAAKTRNIWKQNIFPIPCNNTKRRWRGGISSPYKNISETRTRQHPVQSRELLRRLVLAYFCLTKPSRI